MTIQAQGPDGNIHEFPDGTDGAVIDRVMKSLVTHESDPGLSDVNMSAIAPQQDIPQAPGFLDRLQSAFDARKAGLDQTVNKYSAGQISMPEAILSGAASGANLANDVIGATVASATPQPVKDALSNGITAVASSPIGKQVADAAHSVGSAYDAFAASHPEAATNLETVGNAFGAAVGFVPLGKAGSLAEQATPNAVKAIGRVIEKSGDASALAKKQSFVQDLVTPKLTPTVKAQQFANSTEQGLLRSRVVNPTASDIKTIDAVSQLPVGSDKSLLKNYEIIADANASEANNLAQLLDQNNVPINPNDILNKFSSIQTDLAKHPFITGDGETAAKRVLDGALEAVTNNSQDASGVLQARKDFDQWVTRLKGEKAFNPSVDSPATIAIQQVRQGLNDIIDKAVPVAGVKESLTKQSSLYRAMDALESKGGNEGKNLVSRFADKVVNGVPGKTMAMKGLVATGTLGAATLTPALAATGAGLYGGARALTAPVTRQLAGRAIQASAPLVPLGGLAQLQAAFEALKARKQQ